MEPEQPAGEKHCLHFLRFRFIRLLFARRSRRCCNSCSYFCAVRTWCRVVLRYIVQAPEFLSTPFFLAVWPFCFTFSCRSRLTRDATRKERKWFLFEDNAIDYRVRRSLRCTLAAISLHVVHALIRGFFSFWHFLFLSLGLARAKLSMRKKNGMNNWNG